MNRWMLVTGFVILVGDLVMLGLSLWLASTGSAVGWVDAAVMAVAALFVGYGLWEELGS